MTQEQQPEALRLAAEYRPTMPAEVMHMWASEACAELRRLHAREQELEAENQRLIGSLEAQRLISDRAIAPESGPSAQLRQPTLKECDEHLYE